MKEHYKSGSLSLTSAVAMGTGVMIGAGIFALTGQVAELAGPLFPLAFLVAAIVSGFSAYSYVMMSRAYPSAGGIAMFLKEAYGRSVMTGACALLMLLSMIINESLVARTFGTYALQLFDVDKDSSLVPVIGVALIGVAFLVNVAKNEVISRISLVAAFLKIGGIVAFALVTLWAADFGFAAAETSGAAEAGGLGGFIAAVALGILAYKGFTTITNDGDELKEADKNIGRAIVISMAICLAVYLLVAWAVGSNLSIDEIVKAKDYSLAEAARPALGNYGLWLTVVVALIATASGLMASMFAVSRMLAMVTKMELMPHRHFGMGGHIQTHTLVYTAVLASLLTIFFDLSRIASLGAIFYLVMDFAVHWGVFRHLREKVGAQGWVLVTAMGLDVIVLAAFLWSKGASDPTILFWGVGGVLMVFAAEKLFLEHHKYSEGEDPNYTNPRDHDQ